MNTYEGEGDEGAAASQRHGSHMPAFGHERTIELSWHYLRAALDPVTGCIDSSHPRAQAESPQPVLTGYSLKMALNPIYVPEPAHTRPPARFSRWAPFPSQEAQHTKRH